MHRIVWLDYLKALGIVAVVVGHAHFPDPLLCWIFSFHMPLFFFASGVLLGERDLALAPLDFARRRLAHLVQYYVFFGLMALPLALCHHSLAHRVSLLHAFVPYVLSLLYGSGALAGPYRLYPVVLWFFPALTLSLALTYSLIKYISFRPAVPVGFVALALLSLALHGHAWPWQLESALGSALFVYLGVCAARGRWAARLQTLPAPAAFPLAALLLLGGVLLTLGRNRLDLRSSYYPNPALDCLCLAFTLGGLLLVACRLPAHPWVRRLAAASLSIFPLHPLLYTVLAWVAQHVFRCSEDFAVYDWRFWIVKCTVALVGLFWLHEAFLQPVIYARCFRHSAAPAPAVVPRQT